MAINFNFINKIKSDEIIFKNQIVPADDAKNLGYRIIALSLDEKKNIEDKIASVTNILNEIKNEISLKTDLISFFEILFGDKSKVFFSKCGEALEEGLEKQINNILYNGGSTGYERILDSSNNIVYHYTDKKLFTYNDLIQEIDKIVKYYSNCLNSIRNFSIQDLLNKKGYNSLQELSDYYQKYLQLRVTKDYKDFIANVGQSVLISHNDFNIFLYLNNNIGFLTSLNDLKPRNEWSSAEKIGLPLSDKAEFFALNKYKIDNFKEYIDSLKISIKTEIDSKFVDNTLYNNPIGIDKFLSSRTDMFGKRGTSVVDEYYRLFENYSYDNGLFFAYEKFLDENVLRPIYEKISEKYNNLKIIYNIDGINCPSFSNFKLGLKNQNFFSPNSSIFLFIIKRIGLNKIPSYTLIGMAKEKIKEILESGVKEINIDDILKNIDNSLKDIDSTLVKKYSGITDEDIELFQREVFAKQVSLLNLEIKKLANSDIMNKILKMVSSRPDDELSKTIEKSFSKNNDKDVEIDIRSLLSQDQIRMIAMSKRIGSEQGSLKTAHSYRDSVISIENFINNEKNTISNSIHNIEIIISKDLIEKFFENLKNILIKQLQQEELFLKGKSNSIGILDNLKKDDTNVTNLPINMVMHKNFSSIASDIKRPDDSLFNMFESFHSQIFLNFNYIYKYFEIFPNEAIEFFGAKDLNQIKNNIIKIFNFLNNKNTYSNVRTTLDKLDNIKINIKDDTYSYVDPSKSKYDYEDEEEYFAQHKSANSGIEFLNKLFENKEIGTKKEKIQKIMQISNLLHNYQNNKYYFDIIINSKFLEKAYNLNIFDIINYIGTAKASFPTDKKIAETINFIIEKTPKLIPQEYLSDHILRALYKIETLNTSDDLDDIIKNLLNDSFSENIRKIKFLLTIVVEYESTMEWYPMALPKVDEVFSPSFSTDLFRFRVLGDLDPYHFRVGIDTDCCQAIGGQGASAAIDSFINPSAGVVVLEVNTNSQWELASQSYFHFATIDGEDGKPSKKAIILDNIEAGKLKEKYTKKFGSNFYEKAYAILGRYLKDKGFDIVGCGIKYTYVFYPESFGKNSIQKDPRHFEITKHSEVAYTDFRAESFYNLLDPKFSFEMPNNITSMEIEVSKKSAAILEACIQKTGNKKAMSIHKLSKILLQYGMTKESADVRRLITSI